MKKSKVFELSLKTEFEALNLDDAFKKTSELFKSLAKYYETLIEEYGDFDLTIFVSGPTEISLKPKNEEGDFKNR